MRTSSFLLLIFFCVMECVAQPAMYRLLLTNKGSSPYNINQPEAFLSPKSIERRLKQHLAVNESDLPIDPAYFEAITETGATIQAYSKWVETIVVNISDEETLNRVSALPFVASIKKVRNDIVPLHSAINKTEKEENTSEDPRPAFGDAYSVAQPQIAINNGLFLHELGYKGAGITIAVIDAGFKDADTHPDYLDMNRILGTKNFTHQEGDVFRSTEQHGANVLSLILANNPGNMIGTAPDASFYLLKSEVNDEENPVEEDYWVAALEYADSLGVDIVTTSLGYTLFDDAAMNHTWDELDGNTVLASRAASMAISKGLVVLHAAGNEGAKAWQKVGVPADASNILTIGAVKSDSTVATFSSWGILPDNRIKPDLMAMGQDVYTLLPNGEVSKGNGTSYATPLIAGMTACLWQALPELTALELIYLIKSSSNRFSEPDEKYGYGLPDFQKAYIMYYPTSINTVLHSPLFFDAAQKQIRLDIPNKQRIRFWVYSLAGQLVSQQDSILNQLKVSELSSGIYIAEVLSEGKDYTCLFRLP
ncbi:MAG: S8 family serine peptidase [Candidatus Symbiothrix sp.]|jgi:subtilisin family serine protease|nr:S8 family serine peptidase [Candidatus Symbiothrix sp.]